MATFACWAPESSEEDDADEVHASEPEYAAEKYAKDRWSDFDHPEETIVSVRDHAGVVSRWSVRAEPDVNFYASPAREEP